MVSKKKPRVVIFPIDCMKGKAKRQYMNIGKVVCRNMYETITEIPTLEEIRAMDKKSGKKLIENLRKLHNAKNLSKQFGISSYQFYNHLLPEFDVKTEPRNRKPKEQNKEQDNQALKETAITNVAEDNVIQFKKEEAPVPIVEKKPEPFRGFNIQLGDILTGEELGNQILNIVGMLDKQAEFECYLEIKAKKKEA